MPRDYQRQLEAILFIQAKPVSYTKVAKWLNCTVDEVKTSTTELAASYQQSNHGIQLTLTDNEVQLTTAGDLHAVVSRVIKDERTGDLTKPSLETLAIIAYRSPITKAELEAIRGINCSLILRNLLIRGLVSETYDKTKGIDVYGITPEYLQLLGIGSTKDLPDFERLHRDLKIGERLALLEKSGDFFQTIPEQTTDTTNVQPDAIE